MDTRKEGRKDEKRTTATDRQTAPHYTHRTATATAVFARPFKLSWEGVIINFRRKMALTLTQIALTSTCPQFSHADVKWGRTGTHPTTRHSRHCNTSEKKLFSSISYL